MKIWTYLGAVVLVLALTPWVALPVGSDEEGKNIAQMIAEAKSSANHEAIAAYYEQEARAAHQQHKKHLDMRASYEERPGYLKLKTSLPWHCEVIAKNYQQTATEYEELAKLHREMATTTK
ncbi:MAG: hypothetical protein HOP18_12675 [Deltaproteobacteria bacterium]|nr:hypothetical protein [Deltaproteobacteria bacterium]